MTSKVFVETSVLINASVYAVVKGSGLSKSIQMQALYFEKSNSLIAILRKRNAEKIGVTSETVVREARNAIRNAVQDEANERGEAVFRSLSIILNQCEERLERNIQALHVLGANRNDVNTRYFAVRKMYDDLFRKCQTYDPQRIKKDAIRVAESTASPPYRALAVGIQRKQMHQEHGQLRSLLNKKPSPNDMMFVAEASIIASQHRPRLSNMFLASTDVQLSPVTESGRIVSCEITDEIFRRFGVRCDWPDRILIQL